MVQQTFNELMKNEHYSLNTSNVMVQLLNPRRGISPKRQFKYI